MTDEERRERNREAGRRYRARLIAEGKPTRPPTTEAERARQREYLKRKRAEAKANGTELAVDTWHKRNPEKHRARVQNYRANHVDRMREITRVAQTERRSTPWGKITNCLVPILHGGVRRNVSRPGKYNPALGYTWAELRVHLEAQFAPDMSWENWGDVWELDHIIPLSSFRYANIEDQEFRDCWAFGNLRPLYRKENATKGSKRI